MRKPTIRKISTFFIAGLAVTIILSSHSIVSAQKYQYTWGLDEWLSASDTYYNQSKTTDAYNTDKSLIPGVPKQYSSGYLWSNPPLSPLKTPSNYEESLTDSKARIHGQSLWVNNDGTISCDYYYGTGYYEYAIEWLQSSPYTSGGPWYTKINKTWNKYRCDTKIYYRRPIPTHNGIGIYNYAYISYPAGVNAEYWYKATSSATVTNGYNDYEGGLRNVVLNGFGVNGTWGSFSAGYNCQSGAASNSGSEVDTLNTGLSSGNTQNATIGIGVSGSDGIVTEFDLYTLADNRCGARAWTDTGSTGRFTGYRVGFDGTAPTAPQIVFVSGKSGGWSNQSTAFTLTGSTDSGSGFDHYEYSIDGGTWTRYSGTVTITAGGWHTIQARAVDHVGNVSYSTATSGIDKMPPTCRVSVAASDWHVGGSPVTLTYSDDLSGVATQQYIWSQSTSTPATGWSTYPAGQQLTPPGSGAWYLYWRAMDNAGNTGSGRFGPYTANADLEVKIQTPNAGYLTGTDVITTVLISDNSGTPILPGDSAILKFTVQYPGGSVYTAQSKAVVCPANDDNLVWFRWHTPSAAGTYTLTASLTAANVSARSGWSDPLTWSIKAVTENAPPQTKLTDTKPSWFSIQTPNPCGYSSALSWSDWVYSGGSFHRCTYTATLNASLTVMPTKTSDGSNRIVTATQDAGAIWTIKSGYGISESVTSGVSLTSSTGSAIEGNSATTAQLAEGRYPEFNYYYAGYFRLFDSTGNGEFQLRTNPYSQYGFRTHYVPVWFPDGTYMALATVSQAWTPAGMLGKDATGAIQIQGALPNDWYVKSYS